MIVILDYALGNPSSIRNMIRRCGGEAKISSAVEDVEKAEKLILPGVGSFDHGINNLKNAAYFDVLQEKVLINKTPILGVCLGAQLLANASEEGKEEGLGWIKGKVVRFDKEKMNAQHLKVPHMGWTDVAFAKPSLLLNNFYNNPRFYFVHSYHWVCDDPKDVMLTATYGYDFTAGVEKENIIGVQFHPEKSHKYGLKLYENFLKNY